MSNFWITIKVTEGRKGQIGQEGQNCKKCDILGELVFIIPLSFSLIFKTISYKINGFYGPFVKVPNIQKTDWMILNW